MHGWREQEHVTIEVHILYNLPYIIISGSLTFIKSALLYKTTCISIVSMEQWLGRIRNANSRLVD